MAHREISAGGIGVAVAARKRADRDGKIPAAASLLAGGGVVAGRRGGAKGEQTGSRVSIPGRVVGQDFKANPGIIGSKIWPERIAAYGGVMIADDVILQGLLAH